MFLSVGVRHALYSNFKSNDVNGQTHIPYLNPMSEQAVNVSSASVDLGYTLHLKCFS